MDIDRINQFFVDIGIIQMNQTMFDLKFFRKIKIKDPKKINQVEFLELMSLVIQ